MFIELPLTLIKNDPNDETDWEKLEEMGLEPPEYPEVIMDTLLNVDWIFRINPSEEEGGCTLWMDSGLAFHTPISFAEIKKKLKNGL